MDKGLKNLLEIQKLAQMKNLKSKKKEGNVFAKFSEQILQNKGEYDL